MVNFYLIFIFSSTNWIKKKLKNTKKRHRKHVAKKNETIKTDFKWGKNEINLFEKKKLIKKQNENNSKTQLKANDEELIQFSYGWLIH